jgi:hypothetical protein
MREPESSSAVRSRRLQIALILDEAHDLRPRARSMSAPRTRGVMALACAAADDRPAEASAGTQQPPILVAPLSLPE